jgi:cytochrome c peroxidase
MPRIIYRIGATVGIVLVSVLALKVSTALVAAGLQLKPQPGIQVQCGAQPCDSVARGFRAFHDRQLVGLGGNGRSCADCHMPADNFQLSPANVEARFQQLQARRAEDPDADDPLFRPIDADDFRVNGFAANDYSNLRQNGLVRITFPLPANIRLIDPATNAPSNETFVDVWRMVPSVNDVRLTGDDGENPWPRGPNPTGGYQLDARQPTLQDQALGALINHAEAQSLPSQRFLDDLAAFQLTLFTNPRVRELADAIDAGTTPLPDPDPPLDALETQGKAVFARACAQCHGGPRQSTTPASIATVRYHGIATQCPRPVDPLGRWQFAACPPRLARNTRVYEVRMANGVTIRLPSSDPGRALLTGFVLGPSPFDDWNKFDVPALRGISATAPYFHNNSAATLEEVVDHYIELFKFIEATLPQGVRPPPVASTDGVNFDRRPLPAERGALLAYLGKL